MKEKRNDESIQSRRIWNRMYPGEQLARASAMR